MKTPTKIVLLALAVAAVLAWPVYSLATSSGAGAGREQTTQTDPGAANDNQGDNINVQDRSGSADDGAANDNQGDNTNVQDRSGNAGDGAANDNQGDSNDASGDSGGGQP